ncbi:hypothetical protein F2P56_027883 [Juglans regia]|uniref:Uncharacterized protein n=1 Tax=Juglans regia TaxID=51240 RepID=A0A833TPZ2_JUGRE|nr:hypothetical protein F2P56_027883 [Juglans regia]
MSNPRKAPEKSNFVQRCNLLSRYFKEKGSFGDLGLGMGRQLKSKETPPETSPPAATTLDLLKNMENSTDQALRQNGAVAPSNAQPKVFFPQLGCFGPQNSIDIAANRTDLRCVAIWHLCFLSPPTNKSTDLKKSTRRLFF